MLRAIIFISVFLSLIIGGHIYLYRRLVRDVTKNPRLRRGGLVGIVAMTLVVIGTLFSFRIYPAMPEPIAVSAWTWLGVAMYLFLITLALSAAKWIALRAAPKPVNPERREFLSKAVATTAIVSAAGVSSLGVYRAFTMPVITDVQVKLPGLPKALDGFTLLQLSDVHIGSVIRQRFIDEVVRHCASVKPDAVVMTGDLVDGSVEHLGETAARLMRMPSRYGTFFCTGNHDYYSGDVEWSAALEQMGVTVLRNRFVTVGDATASFDLIGVDDYGARREGHGGWDLEKAVAGRDPSRASVLLAHQPAGFEEVVKKGLGLQLSGHTHGGQLFPFTAGVKLAWKNSVGRYDEGNTALYVSRGTGFWGPPMRVGSPPEIVRVTLLS